MKDFSEGLFRIHSYILFKEEEISVNQILQWKKQEIIHPISIDELSVRLIQMDSELLRVSVFSDKVEITKKAMEATMMLEVSFMRIVRKEPLR